MFVMANDIVEASMCVDLVLYSYTLWNLLKVLVEYANIVKVIVRRTRLISLLEWNWVVFFKVETLDEMLQDLDDLFPCVLFIFRTAWARLEILVIQLTVDLC